MGKDEKTVRNWIRTGRIHAEKPHGKWEIAKAELDAVLADEFKSGDRKAEQEQGSVRSSGNAENKGQPKPSDRKTEREKESPTDTRSDARSEVLETQNAEMQHRVEEKNRHISDLKDAHEKQISTMVQRLNEKDTRIKEIREAHQKERETHLALLKVAQDLGAAE